MARLSETDRKALLKTPAWTEPDAMRSPRIVEPTPEGRARYVRWASEASKFFKGSKPVRFVGEHWKL
ncbi:hypothetical protein QEH52_15810 [Coraliomargarita sp. SDUM461003]|uniref:Uncharacterized protein n=1 Tax=Thalassobacterium maritimum TaxID=3041265 RepID=A0ABU1AXW5_9BACT|nr:hypothetical protein [Coraliomargarita sp. SDUM461003]MDQ8208992.1 hypothetical protein [Coraliomargarita sp. SDUM461003]